MANVKLTCPFPDCDYDTGDGNEVIAAAALLNAHAMTHQQKQVHHSTAESNKQRPPGMDRPRISFDSTAEDWQIFLRKWQLFKRGTSLPDDQITSHLWQCCESSLADALFQQVDDPTKITENELLGTMKALAVVHVAASVRKANLFSLRQEQGQPIRAFAADVTGTARICSFVKTCTKSGCGHPVDYTQDIVKHVIISGIVDTDIRRDILSVTDLDSKSLEETIALIESKEMVARILPNNSASYGAAASSKPPAGAHNVSLKAKLSLITQCKTCGKDMNKFKLIKRRGSRQETLKEFSQCISCWRSAHPHHEHPKGSTPSTSIAPISHSRKLSATPLPAESLCQGHNILLDHYIFDGTSGWSKQASKERHL